MSAIDAMQKELEDIEFKLSSARAAAVAPGASDKDKADLKLIEQEYLATEAKARRLETIGAKATDHQRIPRRRWTRSSTRR
jgi:hypothetical protein